MAKKWTSTAGPRQTKQVIEALRKIPWEGKSSTEINGVVGVSEHRACVTNLFGHERPESLALTESIGALFSWTITRENFNSILRAVADGLTELVKTRPEIDSRRQPEEIKARNEENERHEQERKQREEIRQAARVSIVKDYPFLTTVELSGKSSHAQGAKNLKTELERTFPGVAFSVKSESYSGGDSINVHWTDGPTTAQVKAISDKYQEGTFDGMTDCYNYNHDDVFPSVFGGAKYVFETRKTSPSLIIAAAKELGISINETSFDQHGNLLESAFKSFNGYHDDDRRIYRQAAEMSA